MATEVKHRRGTTAQIEAAIPAQSEFIHNVDTNRIHIGDGSTSGGIPVALLSDVPDIQGPYPTVEDVSNSIVNPSTQFVETKGYADVGDGGDTLYSRTDTEPSHTGWVQSADGGIFAITKRTVRASQFGASPSLSDNSIALNSALQYLRAIGGGCLELDTDGEYLVNATVGLTGFTQNIIIENSGGGVVRAANGLSTAVMSFRGASSGVVPSTGKLSLYGVRTNNQDGNTGVGVAGCTGLDVNYIDYLQADDYECYGGELPQNTKSDSGISTVGVRVAIINNPRIRGQGDAAIYPNWDNTGTVDGYFEVNGGHYSRNQAVLTAKRNLKDVVWRGGLLLENRSGLTTQWVNNGGFVHPALNLHVSGVTFRKTLANVIQVKGNSRLFMDDCRITDIGYEYDGSGNVGANARAIILQGSRNSKISGVGFEMKDWASNLEYAFGFSIDATTGSNILPGNNVISGCVYRSWYRTVIGGNVGDPNRWSAESYSSAALESASDQHAASRVDYFLTGDKRRYTRIGTVSSNETFNTHVAPVTVSLTSLGTLASGSQTAVQEVSIPGLLATDNVHVTRLTSALAGNPGLLISVRTIGNGVQYVIRNSTASSIDLSGQSLRFSF